eukprot:11202290-Lingulodinium_polyedra.AAC.1
MATRQNQTQTWPRPAPLDAATENCQLCSCANVPALRQVSNKEHADLRRVGPEPGTRTRRV